MDDRNTLALNYMMVVILNNSGIFGGVETDPFFVGKRIFPGSAHDW